MYYQARWYLLLTLLVSLASRLSASQLAAPDPLSNQEPVWEEIAKEWKFVYRHRGNSRPVRTTQELVVRFIQRYDRAFNLERGAYTLLKWHEQGVKAGEQELLGKACKVMRRAQRAYLENRTFCDFKKQNQLVAHYYSSLLRTYVPLLLCPDLIPCITSYLLCPEHTGSFLKPFWISYYQTSALSIDRTLFDFAYLATFADVSIFAEIERWGAKKAADYFWVTCCPMVRSALPNESSPGKILDAEEEHTQIPLHPNVKGHAPSFAGGISTGHFAYDRPIGTRSATDPQLRVPNLYYWHQQLSAAGVEEGAMPSKGIARALHEASNAQ